MEREREDVTGKKFGRLTFVKFVCLKRGSSIWECLCDCGNKKLAYISKVKNGKTKSCGCLIKEKNLEYENLVGKTYNRLTIISEAPRKKGVICWNCKCICGNKTVVSGTALRGNHTKSCGCLVKEVSSKTGKITGRLSRTHGKTNTPEWNSWSSMRKRCKKTSLTSTNKTYFDRGITVCQRWNESFEEFLKDLGPMPLPKYQVDRIDNSGNYSCGHCKECLANGWELNCRWATSKQQGRNKRSNVLITYDGKTQCIATWADEYNIRRDTLRWRLHRLGWTIEQALKTPLRKTIRS